MITTLIIISIICCIFGPMFIILFKHKKTKEWFKNKLCIECNKNESSSNLFIDPYCEDCYWNNYWIARDREEAVAKEQRISEQAEALRRAFPNGPYR
jgi:hypothetical protein